jgi:hypothetical protein
VATGNFNNQRTGYQQIAQSTSIPSGYNNGTGYKIPVGNNNGGFLPLYDSTAVDQYNSGGLKGYAKLGTNMVLRIYPYSGNRTSFFYMMFDQSATTTAGNIARLMYMHKR